MRIKFKNLLFVSIMASALCSFAQNNKVETVRMIMEEPDQNVVKDLRECKRLIDEAKEHPKTANSPKMWVYRGAVYLEIARKIDDLNKETPDAIKIAAESIIKCKETDTKNAWLNESDFYMLNIANVIFNAGIAQYQAKNYDKAIDYYLTTLKFISFDKKGDLKTIDISEDIIYQYSYYSAMAKGDNKQTKEFILKLIERNFNDPKIYSALAKVYLEELDTTSALSTLATSRDKYPTDMDLLNMELDIFLKLNKTDILIKKLDDAILADDQNKIYFFVRAATYDKLNKFDLAEKDYLAAIKLEPDYYDANFNMGVLYINKARPVVEELIKSSIKADQLKLETNVKEIYTLALKYFEKCLELGVPDENKKEKNELVKTMAGLYKNVGNKIKEAEMKALIE